MLIRISNGNEVASIGMPEEFVNNVIKEYPEMSMMVAMEELSELIQAVSKCVRNGSDDKKDNLAEEIADVFMVIQWMITRFNIPISEIQKWANEKHERALARSLTNDLVFRSEEAHTDYLNHTIPTSVTVNSTAKKASVKKPVKKNAKDIDKVIEKVAKKSKKDDSKKKETKKKDDKKKDEKKGKKSKK